MIDPQDGILLIADPFLKDENFMRSVVLICTHEEGATFGFALNKMFDRTLDELVTDLEEFPLPVYIGGPVQLDTIHYVHNYPDLPGSKQVSEGIYWGGDFEILKMLLKNNTIEPTQIKFFLGYSGWEKDQLATELEEKSWLTATSTRKLVFDTFHEEIWKECLRHLGGKYEMMINYPIDPQLN